MPVYVECHGYCGVPEQVLHLLRRQFPATACLRVDAPAGKEMPESVRRVLGLSILVDEPGCFHYRINAAVANAVVILWLARSRREHKISGRISASTL